MKDIIYLKLSNTKNPLAFTACPDFRYAIHTHPKYRHIGRPYCILQDRALQA
jgi:hypothetical protein